MQFHFGTPQTIHYKINKANVSRYSYHINLQNETFGKVQYRPRYFQNIKNFVIYDRIEIFDPEQVHDFLE